MLQKLLFVFIVPYIYKHSPCLSVNKSIWRPDVACELRGELKLEANAGVGASAESPAETDENDSTALAEPRSTKNTLSSHEPEDKNKFG